MSIRNYAVLLIIVLLLALPVIGQNITGSNSTANITFSHNATEPIQNSTGQFGIGNATIDQLLEIMLPYSNLSGIELAIIKNQTSFRFAGTSRILAFNPRETGTYLAIVLNNSIQVANASFNVTLPALKIIPEKNSYRPGEIVKLYLYPNAEAQVFLNFSNSTYQLFETGNGTFAFEARDEGTYILNAISAEQEAMLEINVTHSSPKISVDKAEYELGEAVKISVYGAAEADSFAIIHDEKTFNLFIEGNEISFTPQEPGIYSAAVMRDSQPISEAQFTVNEAALPRAAFDLDSNAAFKVNFTELLENKKTAFQRMLSISPLARLTAYVEGKENDARFHLSITPVSQEVFIATVLSNPEIEPGNYTLVIKALVGEQEITELAPFTWTGQHATAEAQPLYNQASQSPLNFTFSPDHDAVIDVKLTKHLSSIRNLIDNLLGRTVINTLAVYVDGHENDELFKPEVEHLLADDFRVTIKADPAIKPGLYQLIVVGTTDKAIIRSNSLFGWGLNDSELTEKISELEKAESEKFSVTGRNGEAISHVLSRKDNNITLVSIPFLNAEITFFTFLERGNLSIWSSVGSPIAQATQSYAVDPSLLIYEKATLARAFTGQAVFSCDYDLVQQQCAGEARQLPIVNGSYYATLNATTAFFEVPEAIAVTQQRLTVTATTPNVKFYRESPDKMLDNTTMNVRFAVITSQPISGMTITDDIQEGWASSHAVNSTHTQLQFHSEGNITIAGYTLKTAGIQNATFHASLTYNNGTASITQRAENDPYTVMVDNRTVLTTDANFSVNGNSVGRELATGITYDATFTLKSYGEKVDRETVFLWPYDSSLISISSITGDCRKAEIDLIKGTKNLKCTWNNFPKNGEKQFTAEIYAAGTGANHSVINVTYDPPRKVAITQLKDAPYEVTLKPEIKGSDLLVDISHDDEVPHQIEVEGSVKYMLSSTAIARGQIATMLVENYNNEQFTLLVGDESFEFGEPPHEEKSKDDSVTELIQHSAKEKPVAKAGTPIISRVLGSIGNFVKGAGVAIKNAFVSSLRFVASIPSGITGLVAANISESSAQPQLNPTATAIAAPAPQETTQQPPVSQPQPEEKPQQPQPEKKAEASPQAEQQPQKIQEPEKPKPEPRIEIISPGRGGGGVAITPVQPTPEPEKKKPKIIEEKVFVSNLQPFTFVASDITVPFEITTKFSRTIKCSKCDDFSVPGNSEVKMKVSAYNFKGLQEAQLADYYPIQWNVTNSDGGSISAYNSTHNKIAWQETGSFSKIEKAYTAATPAQAKDSYSFKSEFSSGGSSIQGKEGKVLIEPFELLVETPSKEKLKSKVKIVNVVKETKDNITVNVEVNFTTKQIAKITLTNLTIEKNSTIRLRYNDVSQMQLEFAGTNFVKVYALDPGNLTFSTGELSATAKGTKLAKCEDWDFDAGKCSGTWKTILNITPGQPYSIEINATDPAWAEIGLVAINTHKSIYTPGELAKIGIGILDSFGDVVCNANATLIITSPLGEKTTRSTGDGSIVVSSQCTILGVTNEPDYFTNYTVSISGSYEMNLTAVTYDGEPYMLSNFTVQDSVPFDVERVGPTRIYPFDAYDFSFRIKANQNYTGNITEVVPATFAIPYTDAMVVPQDSATKLVVWNTSMSAGGIYTFTYNFDAPDISPLRYELGPLSIGSFEEARKWQIASDAGAGTWVDNELACSPSAVANGSAVNCTITYTCTSNPCVRGPAGFQLQDDAVTISSSACTTVDFRCLGVTVTGNCTDTTENDATCRGGYGATGCSVGQAIVIDYSFSACSGVEAPTSANTITAVFTDDANPADNDALTQSFSLPILETIPPNVSIMWPLSNRNLSGLFNVTALANDSQSNLNNVNLSLLQPGATAAGPIPMILLSGTLLNGYFNKTFDSTTVPDGIYNLSVNATDAARNTRISPNVSVIIDNTKPNATIVSPVNVSNFSTTFIINASVNDTLAKVFNISYRVYNSSTNATPWLYSQRNSGDITSGYWNATVPASGLLEGLYNITVNATDFSGNQLVANISQFRIDKQATANISFVSPLNSTIVEGVVLLNVSVNDTASLTGSVAFRMANQSTASSWTAAERTSGTTAQGYWTAEFNTVVLSDGTYNVTVNATDFAGNQQVINISWLDIDNVPDTAAPNASIITPVQNANVSGMLLVNASVNDTLGTVAKANLTLYNNTGNATGWLSMTLGAGNSINGFWNITIDTTELSEGYYNLSVNATDAAINSNISQNVSILVDNTKPNATALSPANGTDYSAQQFNAAAAVNDSGSRTANVSFRLIKNDGSQTGAWKYATITSGTNTVGEWTASLDAGAVSTGSYNITLNATDFSGNQQIINATQITITNTPPNVSIVYPAGGNFSGIFVVNASVNSSGTVTDVNLSLLQPGSASGPYAMALNTGTATQGYWTVSFDSSVVGDGLHNLSVNASYGSGNYNISQNVSILIDNLAPNVTVISPTNNSIVSNTLVINASVNDSANDVINVTFRLANAQGETTAWLNSTLNGTPRIGYWNSTLNTKTLKNTQYDLIVNATDAIGNQRIATISTITVDNRNRAAGEKENNLLMTQGCRLESAVSCGPSATNCETFSSACSGTYPAECPADRLSCNDVVNESTSTSNNAFSGANISAFNSSIINCRSITSVRVCYDWYQFGTSKTFFNCNLGIDNAGDLSWTRIPISCPTTTADMLTCVDVSSHETPWLCSDFFGISQPSAWAYLEGKRTEAGSGTNTLHIDALYFNVTYDIDERSPNTSILTPVEGANISGSFLVNVSINESTAVVRANLTIYNNTQNATGTLKLTNGEGNTSIGHWNLTFDSTTLPDGFYNLSVNATDSTGQINVSANRSITIDNTKPNATILLPANDTIFGGLTILMNASVNDSPGEVQNVSFMIRNAPGTISTGWLYATLTSGNIAQGYWSTTRTSATLPNGKYNITINASDFAGNRIVANISQIEVATKVPNVTIARPLPLANISTTLFVNASVNSSGIITRANATLYNHTGNVTGYILMALGAGTTSAGYWTATIDTSTIPVDGLYNISVNATDAGGNVNISPNVTVVIDNTKPNASALLPANGTSFTNQIVEINASVNDTLTKIFNVSFRLTKPDGSVVGRWLYARMNAGTIAEGYWNASFDSVTLPNGQYNITVNATDFAGNQKLSNISQITIDNILPNVSIVFPVQHDLNRSGTFLVNASVNSSTNNVNDVNLSLLSPGSVSGPFPMQLTSGTPKSGYRTLNFNSIQVADGFYNISVNATDVVQNFQISSNVSVIIDNTKPNATTVAPLNETNHLGEFLINASVNDSFTKVFNVSFRLITADSSASSEWLPATLNTGTTTNGYWNASFDISTLKQARYNITVNATDYAGNRFLSNISAIFFDNTIPNSSITYPAQFANVSGLLNVNVSVNDTASGIRQVNLTTINPLGNRAYFSMSQNSGSIISGYWNATINTALFSEGNYNLTVNATDFAGNTNYSLNISVVFDNTRPNASITVPVNNSVFEESIILINASVNDSLTRVFNATFRLMKSDGSIVTPWLYSTRNSGTITTGYWNASYDSTSLVNGFYNITINATDFAGNRNMINISQIEIANVAPNVTISFPLPGANISGSMLVNASINDSGSANWVNLTILNNTGIVASFIPMSIGTGTASLGTWNATVNTPVVIPRDGKYNLSVNATDGARNIRISENISVNIDNTKPNATAMAPVNRSNNFGLLRINASVNDSTTGVFNISYRLTTSSGSTVTPWLYSQLDAGSGTIYQGYWNSTIDMATIPQGRYNITINATDFAGNQLITNLSEIYSDNRAPNATILTPTQYANISGSFLIRASINDSSALVQKVNATLHNNTGNATGFIQMTLGAGSISNGFWNSTLNSATLPDGKYNISVNATDYVGNTNITANTSITIDNTPANITAVLPLNDTVFEEIAIFINASVNDTPSRVQNVTFRFIRTDGAVVSQLLLATLNSGTIDQGYWNASISSTAINNGLYNITANVTDFAGNSKLVNISQVEVANVPPNASIVFPLQGANISGSMLVNASVNDSGAVGFVNVTFYNNTGNVTGLIPMALTTGNTKNGYWTATINTLTLIPRDGTYNISVNGTDTVGNINISGNVSVFIDNTKPNATAVVPANSSSYIRRNILINASVNDSITGIFNATFRAINRIGATQWIYATRNSGNINQGYWNATIDSLTLADGFYNITINATDFAGNQIIANVSSIAVDNDAPNTTIILPIRNANISRSFIINTSINDTGGFATKVNATISNNTGNATGFIQMTLGAGTATAGYWNATFDGTTLPNGRYNITVNATNNYGNTNISVNTSITIDNLAANATIVVPVNGTNASGNFLINATINDSLSGIAAASFKIYNYTGNASIWLPATLSPGNILAGYWNATFNSPATPDGSYNITVNATDFAGNSVIANISSIFIDNTLPTVTLNAPPNGTANDTTSVAFTATVNDNSGTLQSCSLLLNGTINKTLSPISAGQELNLTVEGFNEGAYLWNVQCTDTAGNTNRSQTNFTIYIDLKAPTSNITTANGTFFKSNTPNITINLTDTLDSIINYTMFVNDEKNHNSTAFSNNATNATLLLIPDGTYIAIVEALDDAGHRVNSSPINFTIDSVLPFVGLIAPANNTNITTIIIQFNFTASDNVDTFLDCGLYIDAVLNQTLGLASGNSTNISIANFTSGLHGWNVSCTDDAQNLNWSQNWFFNVTNPDLEILAENISFNTTSFEENRNFTVFANITNKGEGEVVNALVEFINNSADGNVLATRFVSIAGGSNATVNITIAYPIGTYAIVVRLDGTNAIPEKDETNNIANKSFTIPMWDIVVGNATGSLVIANANSTAYIFSWVASNQSPGNIFIADIDSQIKWANLTALSRNITGNYSEDDFAQLDVAINSTGYNDSVNRTFTANSMPRENLTFNIFAKAIAGVPVVNSTNTSSFRTGILWDANDSISGEYNGSQDVVFVTQINASQPGQYGTYDYEIRVPATLRKLKGPDFNSVVFYMELT